MIAPLALLATMTASDFTARDKDWRCGPVVYQVFVDRFARPKTLNAALFPAPKVLHEDWDRPVVGGTKGEHVWSHELDFYGGDLAGIQGKLSYIKGVGADVLYTTPVFSSLTNHRYDAQDYRQIAPELGGQPAFESLLKATHKQGMKFMLDGVFNHMGASSPFFKKALSSPSSKERAWFEFGTQYPLGYKGWAGVPNLPALNLENKVVRDQLWLRPDSVVQQWLKAGIDGWRLDVAFELGPQGICVNAIQAGVTDTPALRKIPGAESLIAYARQRNPFNRLTTPDDVARLIALLATDAAGWVNGTTIQVDGGEDSVDTNWQEREVQQ